MPHIPTNCRRQAVNIRKLANINLRASKCPAGRANTHDRTIVYTITTPHLCEQDFMCHSLHNRPLGRLGISCSPDVSLQDLGSGCVSEPQKGARVFGRWGGWEFSALQTSLSRISAPAVCPSNSAKCICNPALLKY